MTNLDEYRSQILDATNDGTSCAKLAKQYNVFYYIMYRFLEKHGSKPRRKKLTTQQEKSFIQDQISGMRHHELAEKYSLSVSVAGDYIRRLDLNNHPIFRKKYFDQTLFDILTEDSLWLLGWFYSDGNVSKSSNKFSIAIHSQDEEVFVKIRKVMKTNQDCLYRSKDKQMCEFYGCDPYIHSSLIRLGCIPNKSLVITYPDFLTEDWQHWAFLRGILEGDGHISLKTNGNRPGFNCEISSGSRSFLDGIANVLKIKLNIDTNIVERVNSNSKKLIIRGGHASILRFLDCIYNDGGATNYLSRKFNIYLAMKEVVKRRPDWGKINQGRLVEGYFTSPEGKIYHVRGIRPFAKEYGVSVGALQNLRKRQNTRFISRKYGWTKPTSEQIEQSRLNGTLITKFY